MTTLGNFYPTRSGFAGTVETLSTLTEVEIERAEKKHEKSPDFRIVTRLTGGRSVCGLGASQRTRLALPFGSH